MKKLILVIALLFLVGCVQDISDIKDPDNVGKKVTVRGTVEFSVKIGPLSGFTVRDDTGSIGVKSDDLPREGTVVTVSGVLIKDTLLGYYIDKE